jgi:predicted phosphodiesterase
MSKRKATLAEVVQSEKAKEVPPEPGGWHRVRLTDRGDGWKAFGFVTDTHLGSKHYRPDVLANLYDWFAEEKVEHVFHGGNWIEGEARFNFHDVLIHGRGAQLDFMVKEYPQREGMVTHYVAGDDHEGWYQQREGSRIGQDLQDKARAAGRNDLHYLAYVECDVELVASKGSAVMRVMHGGGGSSYAVSYRPQKIVESWTGGEKPQVLLLGHYHKISYNVTRNVHVVQGGCTEDQSIFMRKKSIEAHVGGCLIRLKQDKGGAITDFVPHFRTFFDRKYYERRYE